MRLQSSFWPGLLSHLKTQLREPSTGYLKSFTTHKLTSSKKNECRVTKTEDIIFLQLSLKVVYLTVLLQSAQKTLEELHKSIRKQKSLMFILKDSYHKYQLIQLPSLPFREPVVSQVWKPVVYSSRHFGTCERCHITLLYMLTISFGIKYFKLLFIQEFGDNKSVLLSTSQNTNYPLCTLYNYLLVCFLKTSYKDMTHDKLVQTGLKLMVICRHGHHPWIMSLKNPFV